MKWVDQAMTRPFRCAVVPYVGNGTGHAFLDTGQDLDLEHVYISDVACEAIAQALGWEPAAPHEQEKAALEAQIRSLEAEVESLREFERSAQWTLEHFGSKVQRKPGRKPKDKVEAV